MFGVRRGETGCRLRAERSDLGADTMVRRSDRPAVRPVISCPPPVRRRTLETTTSMLANTCFVPHSLLLTIGESMRAAGSISPATAHTVVGLADTGLRTNVPASNGILMAVPDEPSRQEQLRELAAYAYRHPSRACVAIPPTLADTKTFVLRTVSYDGLALRFASERLRTDKEVVAAAVAQNKTAWKYSRGVLPKLYVWALKRLRQQRAARVYAQVDKWMIRRAEDGFSRAAKRMRVE